MTSSRRQFVRVVGATGAAAALSGCDSAADALAALAGTPPAADFRPPSADAIDLATHVLDRITWGPRPGDYRAVLAQGPDAFIEAQLEPERIGDRRCEWRAASIESVRQPASELYEYPAPRLLFDMTRHKLVRAVYSRRQLFEVMVDFWTDHFNIVSGKGHCKWLKAADDATVIRAHAMGRFRDLVRASALSPAMLIYLDGHDNKVETPGDRPNENYARELLELHTLGVRGGYSQRDVAETARCLSGWTYRHEPLKLRPASVRFVPARHDDGPKEILGHAIPAGGGAGDLERVLDIVCGHPATARHLAWKLCRRFIADPPPDEAVATVAAAFTDSDGDVPRTLRALFATDVFRGTRGNLFKRPLRFVVSALRACDAGTDCGQPVIEALDRMGHAPFQYPTPDGYPIETPPWLGSMLWRWNFGLALESGAVAGTKIATDREPAAAHFLGRRPTEAESAVLGSSATPLALLLASPAFQLH